MKISFEVEIPMWVNLRFPPVCQVNGSNPAFISVPKPRKSPPYPYPPLVVVFSFKLLNSNSLR